MTKCVHCIAMYTSDNFTVYVYFTMINASSKIITAYIDVKYNESVTRF